MRLATRGSRLQPVFAAVAVLLLAALPESAAQSQLQISPLSWIPVAAVAVLAVIGVAGLVYALSYAIGSANARAWSRAQVYEALLSLLMLVAFGALSYLFFLNPQPAFGALGLVPNVFPVLGSPNLACQQASSIFELGTCDLALFNDALYQVENLWYMLSYLVGIVPTFGLTVTPLGVPGLGFTIGNVNLVPFSDLQLITTIFGAFMTFMMLQQIQLLILSSSILLFSLFLVLGLVARTFGFTRTFGGAMIAFGLGLGFVYPLLTSITYGFIDTSAQLSCLFLSSQILATLQFSQYGNCILVGVSMTPAAAVAMLFALIFQSASGVSLSTFLSALGPLGGSLAPLASVTGAQLTSVFIAELGYILAGITFIPFLNFIIVDTFIIDFSTAIGERMDFMRLLTGIV